MCLLCAQCFSHILNSFTQFKTVLTGQMTKTFSTLVTSLFDNSVWTNATTCRVFPGKMQFIIIIIVFFCFLNCDSSRNGEINEEKRNMNRHQLTETHAMGQNASAAIFIDFLN